jgi:CRP/FNR family transcriptional regulator, dissimilatory nitrate respiration regulator
MIAPTKADEKILQSNSLFMTLTKKQFAQVLEGMRIVTLKSNETLFDTETVATRFYILSEGQIKLFRLSQNGTEKIVEIIRPGDDFATAVMFMEIKQYPLCANAIRKSRVLSFNNRQLLDILRNSPETCFRMMGNMSRRLRWQLSEIDRLSLQTAPARLVTFILDQIKPSSSNIGQIKLDAPKQIIASRLSIQPETFSRILKKLSGQNLIQVKGQVISIPDIEALALYIEESC